MQVLRRQCVDEEVHPCNIATWSIEADDQTGLNRIGTARKNDWNRGSSRHGCRSRSIVHDQDGYLPLEQVSRQCWQAIIPPLRPAIFDRDVLADDVVGFFQALDKAVPGMCEGVRGGAVEKTDHRHRLLRERRNRPRRRAAEQCDELPPSDAGHGRSSLWDYRTLSLPLERPVGPWERPELF